MQSMFTLGRTQDLIWTHTRLDKLDPMKNWSDFGEETVDDLGPIAF